MSQHTLINNTARAAQQRDALAHALEILRSPVERPWRAITVFALLVAWPYLISGLVALTNWWGAPFHG